MEIVALIGRILFALVFLGSGAAHLTQTAAMTGYAKSKKVPYAQIVVLASGTMIVLGALMILFGVWGDLGALLLVAFLVPTAVVMHNFWTETDPQTRQVEMVQFMKDLSLAGGALLVFVLYSKHGDDLGLTITGPLF
ncbi:MAG: DoxX family protein [Micromonosporaceae bacterium]